MKLKRCAYTICWMGLALVFSCEKRADPPMGGIVVDQVQAGGGGDVAGLLPGDVLVSWQREETPIVKPEGGSLKSPFDWMWLEPGETPIDDLNIRIYRAGRYLTVPLDERPWKTRVRPVLAASALSHYKQGRRLADDGDWDGANRLWQETARDLAATGHREEACWLLFTAAESFQLGGSTGTADTAFQAAETLAVEIGPYPTLSVLVYFSKAKLRKKDFHEAQAPLARALDLAQTHFGDTLETAYIHYLLGAALLGSGASLAAKPHLKRAYNLQRTIAPGSSAVAKVLINLAALAEGQGMHAATAAYFRHAAKIEMGRVGPSSKRAKMLAGLGAAQRAMGQQTAAEQSLREALTNNPDKSTLARVYTELGHMYNDLMALDLANDHYQIALGHYPEGDPNRFFAYNGMGTVATQQDRFEKARAFFSEARALAALHHYPLRQAVVLINLAQMVIDQNQPEAALTLLGEASPLLEQYMSRELKAYHARLYGKALRLMDRLEESGRYLRQAVTFLNEAGMEGFDLSLTYYELALLDRLRGEPEQARNHLHRSIAAIEEQLTRIGPEQDAKAIRSRFNLTFLEQYKELIDLDMASGRPRQAFITNERSRAAVFLRMLATRELVMGTDLPAGLWERRLDLIAERRDLKEQLDEMEENIDQLETLQTRLAAINLALVSAKNEFLASTPHLVELAMRPVDVKTAAGNLDPGTLLLSYSLHREHIYLFALLDNDFHYWTLPTAKKTMERQVKPYLDFLRKNKTAQIDDLNDRAHDIYQILLGPADDLIERAQQVLIVSDGLLHLLPFEALPRDKPVKGALPNFLGLGKPVHYVQSCTLYETFRNAPSANPEEAATGLVVAFGPPESSDKKRPPLPSAKHEVEKIAQLYGSAATLARSEHEFKQIQNPHQIIHFATHAEIEMNRPMKSRLVLTNEGEEDGLLHIWEVLEMDRVAVDLVVLSACDTSVGPEMGGEGLLSMARAFQFSGARSVMATRWRVDDAKTADLMNEFYQGLRDGRAKDEALRHARQRFLEDYPDNRQPYYWAAFALIGDRL